MSGKFKIISILISLITLILIIVWGYTQRYYLFQYFPSTQDTDYTLSDEGLMVHHQTQQPYSGRLRSENEERTDIYSYKNGEIHGLNASYKNGKIIEIGHWKDSLQNGRFQLYTEEGVLVDDGYFSDGERHGITKQYYPSGKLHIECSYEKGQLDGLCKQFNEAGILTIQLNYSQGVMDGKALYYYDDGKLKLEANFEEGIPNKDAYYWTETGIEMKGTLDTSGVFTPY